MNFFKSVFADDDHVYVSESDSDSPAVDAVPTESADGAPWDFGRWYEYYNDDDDKKVVKLDDNEGHPSGVVKDEGCQSKATNPASSVLKKLGMVGLPPPLQVGRCIAVDADKKEGSASSLVAGRQVLVDSVTESSIEGGANTENGLDVITKSFEQGIDQNTNYTKKTDKESDSVAVLSRLAVSEEEDLGWDEIENLSSIDDNGSTTKAARGADPSSNWEELRKRLTIAEEEEDLSWDIEDDDAEPAKP